MLRIIILLYTVAYLTMYLLWLAQVVVVKSDEQGNVDLVDLAEKAEKHKVRVVHGSHCSCYSCVFALSFRSIH